VQGAILLDRDGTLVDVVRDEELGVVNVAFHPSQLRLLQGVVEGLRLLRDAGYVFGIATNQPGPAKGQISIEAVARTNLALDLRSATTALIDTHQ
jgi:D-glycero-D-manno-heptose 1,7-bisphosphate phosphatase